jgi:hypothetical protein
MFSSFKDQHLNSQIGKGMDLQVLIWHSGMQEVLIVHMGYALEALRKRVNEAYVEQHNHVK